MIASLGANRKDKPNGEISARVLFDGTNGLQVNTRTRLRDQERSPIAADLKRAMREKATLGVRTFALTADVKEAHRQVPIHPRDWHLLGCRVEAGTDVYINTVETFGVASASNYWSRVSSALGRLSQYLAAASAHTWHMVVADDYHLEAGGEHYRFALFAFFLLCCTCGCHFLGTRRQVARQLSGWGWSCSTAPTTWASLSAEQSGSRNGPEKSLIRIRSAWGGLRKASGASCLSWGRSSSRGLSSDPCIDSCRSIPDPQCAKFHPTSDSSSAMWPIGYQALGTTTAHGGTTSGRAGKQRKDWDWRMLSAQGTGRQDRY